MTDHRGQGPSQTSTRYPVRIALILAAAAAVLRLAVIFWRRGHDPLFHQPINDASIYDQWARALVAGQGFGLDGAPYFFGRSFDCSSCFTSRHKATLGFLASPESTKVFS